MDKKIIVANWKMNPQTLAEAEDLYRLSVGVIVCPPFVYLEELSKIKSGAVLGSQDISLGDEPGQTGEISGRMLTQFGVKYVIVGHSERRWPRSRSSDGGSAVTGESGLALRGESDAVVNAKIKMALAHELTPIVCFGEKSRDNDFKTFLQQQVSATFAGLSADQIEKCLITYEPVWAISTNLNAKPDTPENAVESINFIKNFLSKTYNLELKISFLYGGSVNSANLASFLSRPEINGVLVGAASVNKDEFARILSQMLTFTIENDIIKA